MITLMSEWQKVSCQEAREPTFVMLEPDKWVEVVLLKSKTLDSSDCWVLGTIRSVRHSDGVVRVSRQTITFW